MFPEREVVLSLGKQSSETLLYICKRLPCETKGHYQAQLGLRTQSPGTLPSPAGLREAGGAGHCDGTNSHGPCPKSPGVLEPQSSLQVMPSQRALPRGT